MSTLARRPLANKPIPVKNPVNVSPMKSQPKAVLKRARSPEPPGLNSSKRAKPAKLSLPTPVMAVEDDKERKRSERDAQKAEFKLKYSKAFPGWIFYFDSDGLDRDLAVRETLEKKVSQMGARIEDFFSNEITHLISNQFMPTGEVPANKENLLGVKGSTTRSASSLKSPISIKSRVTDELGHDSLVKKAIAFGIKIWNTSKLESVLERCLGPDPPVQATTNGPPISATASTRPLQRLLQSERIHGSAERDPTQKRHDYRYFSRASCFVLVEDMRQEIATIAAHEYPTSKSREGGLKGTWPVLHCHPKARGPFIEYDEREKRRWEKSQRVAKDRKEKMQKERLMQQKQDEMKRRAEAKLHAEKLGDLRRSASMNNLHRRASFPVNGTESLIDLDGEGEIDAEPSANASGFLASGTGGYMAASGNSVFVTSTTGTTSAGNPLRGMDLPLALRGRLQQEVTTSRKFPSLQVQGEKAKGAGTMGPPKQTLLRKSKSTNTMRLPKREEGKKPGYCESCRTKFEDFKTHVKGRRHRNYAREDSHFLQLDFVLRRVQRRTLADTQQEKSLRESRRRTATSDSDAVRLPNLSIEQVEEPWDDTLDAEGEIDLDI